MKLRSPKSRTADLFAAEYRPAENRSPVCRPDASSAPIPVASPAPIPVAPAPISVQTVARHTRSRPSPRQLWYAAVFPEMARESAALLQQLCLHAQTFTSFVSIEQPNALLLEIKGSVKLFGSLQRLHADM